MTHIINGCGTGKTRQLMMLAKNTGGTIICSNPEAMENKCHAYGITGVSFASYHDYLDPTELNLTPPFYIDEIEKFLFILGGGFGRIEGYTLTKED